MAVLDLGHCHQFARVTPAWLLRIRHTIEVTAAASRDGSLNRYYVQCDDYHTIQVILNSGQQTSLNFETTTEVTRP